MTTVDARRAFRNKFFTNLWCAVKEFEDPDEVLKTSFDLIWIQSKAPEIEIPGAKNGDIYKYHFVDKDVRALIVVTPLGPVFVTDLVYNNMQCGDLGNFRVAFPNKFPLSFRRTITRHTYLTNEDLIRILGLESEDEPNIGMVIADLAGAIKNALKSRKSKTK